MKLLLLTLAVLMSLASPGHADLIAKGTAIAEARTSLMARKHTQTGLDMATTAPDTALDFWDVDQGVLILSYSTKSGLISGLSYTLMDERPKAFRKEFDFAAESFDTITGSLVLSTKKPQ
jgi:hypothetical protein